jgi:hypothetical protein
MNRRQFIAGLGGAAAWPVIARAQFLSGIPESGTRLYAIPFHRGLGKQGYVNGRNVEILYSNAETKDDNLLTQAEDLVRRRVSVTNHGNRKWHAMFTITAAEGNAEASSGVECSKKCTRKRLL